MTDEIDQIVNVILEKLPTYAVNKQSESLAPSVTVQMDSVANSHITKDHIYELLVRSTSAANLKIAVDTLLKLDSNHPSGYVNHYSYPEIMFDDETIDAPPSQFSDISTDLTMQVKADIDGRDFAVAFKHTTPTGAYETFKIVDFPASSNSYTMELWIKLTYGSSTQVNFYANTTALLMLSPTDNNLLATRLYKQSSFTNETAAYTGNWIRIKLVIAPGSSALYIDGVLVNSNTGFTSMDTTSISVYLYQLFVTPTPTQYIDMIDFSWSEGYVANRIELGYVLNTTYPYYLESKFLDQYCSENEFEARIALLARWTNS